MTVYDSIAAPPLLPGTVNATVAEVFVASDAEVAVGALGACAQFAYNVESVVAVYMPVMIEPEGVSDQPSKT